MKPATPRAGFDAPAAEDQADDDRRRTSTAWTLMGARSWRLCRQLEEQASTALRTPSGAIRTDLREPLDACPQVPSLLVLAVRNELTREAPKDLLRHAIVAPEKQSAAQEEPDADELSKRRQQWLAWLTRARREAMRQGAALPPQTTYLTAYVLVGLERAVEARRTLEAAVTAGEVERWRSDRMYSVIALLEGQLERALRLAFRSVIEAPAEDQLVSRYIWAWVLDRSGATAAAQRELHRLRREAGALSARTIVETLLPLHERLYFRALTHQAFGDSSSAAGLWEAYLRHPRPAAPERELARRHLAELATHEASESAHDDAPALD